MRHWAISSSGVHMWFVFDVHDVHFPEKTNLFTPSHNQCFNSHSSQHGTATMPRFPPATLKKAGHFLEKTGENPCVFGSLDSQKIIWAPALAHIHLTWSHPHLSVGWLPCQSRPETKCSPAGKNKHPVKGAWFFFVFFFLPTKNKGDVIDLKTSCFTDFINVNQKTDCFSHFLWRAFSLATQPRRKIISLYMPTLCWEHQLLDGWVEITSMDEKKVPCSRHVTVGS